MTAYLALLEKWNTRINLTASTAWATLEPLFREALWASRFYPAKETKHLDIGSGAGFPALPLRILVPRMSLEMVESRAKKCVFLEAAAAVAESREARVHCTRLAGLLAGAGRRTLWDCISWKGVKIGTADLLRLREHAGEETQFWMFHGAEAAVEDAAYLERDFTLLRRVDFPGRRDWHLSMFHVKH